MLLTLAAGSISSTPTRSTSAASTTGQARARCLGRFALLGLATHAELARAHGISARTVARARRQMEARGEQDFDKRASGGACTGSRMRSC